MKNKTKLTSILLITTLIIGTITSPMSSALKAHAKEKAYCASLKLNNNIKLNKKKAFTKTGIYQEMSLFKEKKKCKIKYTINCSRKSSGNNYKVTYKVNYQFFDNPKIDSKEFTYEDWWWGFTQPEPVYTVFDYQTGISLESKNKLDVKTKANGKWKYTYYPKQYFKSGGEETWLRNIKTLNYSFTVTYPKKCKDVCVGIGFVNMINFDNKQYWDGKEPYGKTDYYKKGKSTMSYMRLNK